jgi:Protein of unknown function (DUF3309)
MCGGRRRNGAGKGYYPSGGLGLNVIILVILILLDRRAV